MSVIMIASSGRPAPTPWETVSRSVQTSDRERTTPAPIATAEVLEDPPVGIVVIDDAAVEDVVVDDVVVDDVVVVVDDVVVVVADGVVVVDDEVVVIDVVVVDGPPPSAIASAADGVHEPAHSCSMRDSEVKIHFAPLGSISAHKGITRVFAGGV